MEYEGEAFERFLLALPTYDQAVLVAAIEHVLRVHGIDICAGDWGKPLGGGLYEFRVRKSLRTILKSAGLSPPQGSEGDRATLLRVFCAFHGDRIVLLLHGYNKRVDPSERRQRREIATARKLHAQWKQRHRSD
ncbi:hypothetical protein [Agrococcus sp. KRD186]|uniref:hypothetical protein n=1 Tax=Agrococcus sp. KRD186 TaxID=2729730 RepID=UPI0019D0618C|nr:hypothetical protein [Agrococcus sp. KRD186]